jgi:hypothetical protein
VSRPWLMVVSHGVPSGVRRARSSGRCGCVQAYRLRASPLFPPAHNYVGIDTAEDPGHGRGEPVAMDGGGVAEEP